MAGKNNYNIMTVPSYDLCTQHALLADEVLKAWEKVLLSGLYESGPEVKSFETEFAQFIGSRYAVSVGSGSDALLLSLLANDIQTGEEVITVANTCISVPTAIHRAGAKIRWVDVDPLDHNMAIEKLEKAICPTTRAVLVVHAYGHPAMMDRIIKLAKARNLLVIEDVAQSPGAEIAGKKVGTFGDAGCFSFAFTKILGSFGDGGMVITENPAVAGQLRLLRDYGEKDPVVPTGSSKVRKLEYVVEGFHSHLSEIQAAALRVKLRNIQNEISGRRRIAEIYNSGLSNLNIQLPVQRDNCLHVYKNYVVQLNNRDAVQEVLANRGISTSALWTPPLHLQPVYRHLGYSVGDLPVTEKLSKNSLALPIYSSMTERQIDYVMKSFREALK